MDVKEKVEAFDRMHGGEKYLDSAGVAFFFADGSVRDVNPLGPLIGVECYDQTMPEYEFKVAENQLTFAKLKLGRAVSDFDELNERLAHTLAGQEELKELRRLQALVEERKAAVAQAEERLGNTRKGRQRRVMLQAQAEEKARFAEFQRERRAIRI